MSIKSTRRLHRTEALAVFHDLSVKLGHTHDLTDEQLGDALDVLAELVCQMEGRTCFDNYLVVPDWEEADS